MLRMRIIVQTTHLSHRVAVGIEETEGVVGARVNGKTDFCDVVLSLWGCLRPSKRAGVVGVAHVELVVILRVGLQVCRFDLIYVRPNFEKVPSCVP